MANTDPKKVKKTILQEAKMCPNCITVIEISMWPNLPSGSKSERSLRPALALEGKGGNSYPPDPFGFQGVTRLLARIL